MMDLTGAMLALLLVGNTHYVDVGGAKDAVIYYRDATTTHMVLPDGKTFRGDWRTTERGYFVAWRDGPQGEWRIGHTPGTITYINPKGENAGRVTRIVPGNPEKF
jgi:hypothetical protein